MLIHAVSNLRRSFELCVALPRRARYGPCCGHDANGGATQESDYAFPWLLQSYIASTHVRAIGAASNTLAWAINLAGRLQLNPPPPLGTKRSKLRCKAPKPQPGPHTLPPWVSPPKYNRTTFGRHIFISFYFRCIFPSQTSSNFWPLPQTPKI